MKSFKNKYVVAPNEEIERLIVERLTKLGYSDEYVGGGTFSNDYPTNVIIDSVNNIDIYYDEEDLVDYKKVSLEKFFSTEWGEKEPKGELTITKEGELPPVKSYNDTVLSFKEYDRTVEIRYNTEKEPVNVEIFAQAIMDLTSASGFNPTHVFEELQHLIEEELDNDQD